MSISPLASTNINTSVGSMLPTSSSSMFDDVSSSLPAPSSDPAAMASEDTETGAASNTSLATELLQTAQGASSPTEKSQLIQAAIDLMGGGSAAAGPIAAATPTASTALPATSTSTPAAIPSTTSSSSGLSVNGNTVNTGRYTITASTSQDGSLTITDNQTGTTDTVWGDPHVDVNGQDEADFQQDGLTLNLPDGTRVEMKPTAEDSNGKSHLAEAVVSNGGQAVTMTGFTGGGGVQTTGVQADTESLEQSAMTPDETVLDAGSDSLADLHFTNADGSQGAALTYNGSEQLLDGSGGADPSGTTPTAGGTGNMQLATQVLQQSDQSTDASTKSDLIQAAIDLMGGSADTAATTPAATDPAIPAPTPDPASMTPVSGAGSSDNTQLATELLQQAQQSTDPQTQNDLMQAAMDLMGGSGAPLSGGFQPAAADLNSEIMSQVTSPAAQSQMQNDLSSLLQSMAA